MSAATLIRRLTRRRVQLTVLSGSAVLCLIATAILASQVFFKLEQYASADRDNIQWTTTQLEVDHAKLVNVLDDAASHSPAALAKLQRQVDVFFSRANTLKDAESYRNALQGTVAAAQIDYICQSLGQVVAIVDAGPDTIKAEFTQLVETVKSMAGPIRKLSTESIIAGSRLNQAERASITTALVQLIALSIVLLVVLLSLLALFWQLYRRYRKRALQNRITLHRLNTILSTSQDAILVVCPSGAIIEGNGAADTMFDLPHPGTPPKMIEDILKRKNEDGSVVYITGDKLTASCANGPNRCTRLTASDKTGREFPIELSANMASRSGDTVCVCFIRDISHRVAAEAEMHAARDKALAGERAKARFLGMVSHEMRTPLNGILGALDLLDDTPLSTEQSRYTQIMQTSGQLVLNQINDALELTQADRVGLNMVKDSFDLDALLDELVQSQQTQAAAQGSTLQILRPATPLGFVEGDQNRLHQVLLNLLSNALKFTLNGQVTIEITRQEGEDEVEFQISDTGIGISEEDLPRVFDDFVRLEERDAPSVDGTGLGLGIARHLVTLMGGTIGAESVRHEGSLFWVRIPLPAAAKPDTTAAGPAPDAQTPRALEVLVVEDNATSRFVLHEMLRKDGHIVQVTSNGTEGVAAAARRAFDLILMDINMPGMDGIEATQQIRSGNGASADTRIVALTAHFRPEHNERLRNTRIDAICTKPLRRAALREILIGGTVRDRPKSVLTGVDTQVLDQLCAVLPQQNLAAVLDDFMREGTRFMDDIPALAQMPAHQQAAKLHHFAGSAATFGAVALQTALCRAEAAALQLDTQALQAELDDLPKLWRLTLEEIESRQRAA